MDDKLTQSLVRAAAGLFIVATVGTGLYFGWGFVSRKMAGRYCANVDVPARCPADAFGRSDCSQQDKLSVFQECMAERGHFFR
jgi:hypothetical protein